MGTMVSGTTGRIRSGAPACRVAHRASIEPFHAMAFGQRAAALEAAGHDIVRLNLGEPDYGAPPAARAAMREVMDGRPLTYTPAFGLPELRSAIAEFYRNRHGVAIDPRRIAVTPGASGSLLLAIAATVEAGDDVVIADPSYPCNREIVKSFGGRVVMAETSPTTRFQLDASTVDRAWTERTTAVMIASPSNPTGTTIAIDELAAICGLARERGAWRIVDEIYLNLADHGPGAAVRPSVLTCDPDAIAIDSFSKYFGMTGWRLGWCVLPDGLVEAVERLAMNYFLCASAPAQLAALACFTPESLAVCEDRRIDLLGRRQIVLDGLADLGLPVPVPPDGAFYAYCDVSGTGLGAWEFCERALDQAHVALTPGRDFGPATAGRFVRFSYAASRDDLQEGLHRLRSFLGGLRRETRPSG